MLLYKLQKTRSNLGRTRKVFGGAEKKILRKIVFTPCLPGEPTTAIPL